MKNYLLIVFSLIAAIMVHVLPVANAVILYILAGIPVLPVAMTTNLIHLKSLRLVLF